MHSDKLGLAPASSSSDSDLPADPAPAEVAATAPAKRPRRTLTRKPKGAVATQLALDVDAIAGAPAVAPAEAEPPAALVESADPGPAVAPPAAGPVDTTDSAPPAALADAIPAPAESAPEVAGSGPADAAPLTAEPPVASAPPARIELPASICHRVHPVALGRKREALQHLLGGVGDTPVLLFTRTKHGADKIARFLERCGINAAAIHGDKSHGARQRAINGFKAGEVKVLVVTDIAARLLDVTGLPLVLSYDLPHVAEDYVQRVLRCGGEGVPGLSLVLITQEEAPQFRGVRDLLAQPLEVLALAGFEAAEPFDPERDPPVRADAEAGETETRAAAPAAPQQVGEARREGRNRRERRNRHRGERADAGEASAELAPAAVAEEVAPEAAVAQARPPRNERPPRREKERREKPEIGNRALPPEPVFDDDDDGPQIGNTLDLPPPSQYGLVGGNYRGRGRRRDPFAPVVIDEDRASIWDERQPDDYRDQWSILGPERGRPSWTYAQDGNVEEAPKRQFQGPPQPRRGGPSRPQQGGGHRGGGQRHGRPRRAEGR